MATVQWLVEHAEVLSSLFFMLASIFHSNTAQTACGETLSDSPSCSRNSTDFTAASTSNRDNDTTAGFGAMSCEMTPVPIPEPWKGRAKLAEKADGQIAKRPIGIINESLTCLLRGCGAKLPITAGKSLIILMRGHIESAHLPEGIAIKCLGEGCSSAGYPFKNLNVLAVHISRGHRGSLSMEQEYAFKQLRRAVNATVKDLFSQRFPDAVTATAAEKEDVLSYSRRSMKGKKSVEGSS